MHSVLKENLERLIKERKYQIAELERKAGVKRNNIYFIIKGISKKPSAELIQSIADALGVTTRELLTPSTPIKTYLDDNDFYLIESIFKDTVEAIKESQIQVTETDLVNSVVEAFNYCRSSKTSDKKFINWIIQQKFKKNSY